MRRRQFIASTGAAAAALSGCTDSSNNTNTGNNPDGGDPGNENNSGNGSTETLSAEEVSFPESMSQNGFDDIEKLKNQNFEAQRENSFRLKAVEKADTFPRTLRNDLSVHVDPENEEMLYVKENADIDTGEVTSTVERYLSVPQEEYFLSDPLRRHRFKELDGLLEQNGFDEALSITQSITGPYLDFVNGFEYEFKKGEDWGEPYGDVVVLEATGKKDKLDMSYGDESSYSIETGTISIGSNGALADSEYRLESTDIHEEHNQDLYFYESSLGTTEIGETEVPRPEWVDEAKQQI